jgi:hypothetical protein
MYDHKTAVVVRRPMNGWLRKRYWVVCAYCGLDAGPFRKKSEASDQADQLSRELCGENW